MTDPRPATQLEHLVGPLRFATGKGALAIGRIQGIARMVRDGVTRWRSTLPMTSPQRREADLWLERLSGYDTLAPEGRRAVLQMVLDGILRGEAGAAAAPAVTADAAPVARPPVLSLDSGIQIVPGLGPKRRERLERLAIRTLHDLLLHVPRRYEDRREVVPIARLALGQTATIRGRVVSTELTTTPRKRMRIFEALIEDGSFPGAALPAFWFNQPYLSRQLAEGGEYLFSGKVVPSRRGLGLALENPVFEPWDEAGAGLHVGRLVAVYPETEGVTSRQLREWVAWTLAHATIPDPLPAALRTRYGLMERGTAFGAIHHPATFAEAEQGLRRCAFEEFFLLQTGLQLTRKNTQRAQTTVRFTHRPGLLEAALRSALPFSLTAAQERVLAEIFHDLAGGVPMHRLVQGDVGCGKTVVALLALLRGVDSGFQGAIMAPTEILAEQHHHKIRALLGNLPVNVTLLLGGGRGKAKRLADIRDGITHIVVGTQALIQEQVAFKRLGLAVIDEQHRFGVRQRAELTGKGERPHTLIMTATPIPRTLAMTAYGDLDVSVIDALPPGRSPVTTRLFRENRRDDAYAIVRREALAGRRAFVVHPLVEESEKLELRAATAAFEELAAGPLADLPLGLLHGRMARADKERVMADFVAGRSRVLVTTTVVEVGVDVPEATVMVVEHAERFGLSQLHQLRGRVGRGRLPGQCLLIGSSALSKDAWARLMALKENADGFAIAERDLEIRGPGELFGQRQSGLPELKVANLIRDAALVPVAREAALALLAEDPGLTQPRHRLLREVLSAVWRHHLKWATVG